MIPSLFQDCELVEGHNVLTGDAIALFMGTFQEVPLDVQQRVLGTLLPAVRLNDAESRLFAASLLILITEGIEAHTNYILAEAAAAGINVTGM